MKKEVNHDSHINSYDFRSYTNRKAMEKEQVRGYRSLLLSAPIDWIDSIRVSRFMVNNKTISYEKK